MCASNVQSPCTFLWYVCPSCDIITNMIAKVYTLQGLLMVPLIFTVTIVLIAQDQGFMAVNQTEFKGIARGQSGLHCLKFLVTHGVNIV